MRVTLVGALVLVAAVAAPLGAAQSTPEADNTVTRVELRADGDARWTVAVRTRLANDSDVAEYRAFQTRFRENTSRYLTPFRQRISGVVADAAEATGRSMGAANFTAETEIQQVPRRYGVVRYSFTWTALARTDADAVVLGDVFDGGLFIAPGDTFVVAAPEGYAVDEVDPAPDRRGDGTVTWVGPQEFDAGAPAVRATPAAATDEALSDGAGVRYGLGALLVAALVGGGVLLYRREDADGESAGGTGAAGESPALLTDADRVERLLEANGGQVKQSAIADELDWTASKTSRVVGELADDGRVEKRRIGRENVVLLPDEAT